jgi:hypothetical protein
MRRPLRHALTVLRDAGLEVDRICEAGKHTEIYLEGGGLIRLVRGNHPSRRFERGLRSRVRKLEAAAKPAKANGGRDENHHRR